MSDLLPPIYTGHLFHGLAWRLTNLLRALPEEAWNLPTCYPTWTVHDIAAHLLQTAAGRLSKQRDRFHQMRNRRPASGFDSLSALIDEANSQWTQTLSSTSPRVLIDLLSNLEFQLARFLRQIGASSATSTGVGWAGEQESPAWFDVAREFTERWHHQQQIREAVGASGIAVRKYLEPVLRTLIRAVPFWYESVHAGAGDRIEMNVLGKSGGRWFLQFQSDHWRFVANDEPVHPVARVEMTEDTAWRFLTRTMPAEAAESKMRFEGDQDLARHFLQVVAVMIPKNLL